MNWTYDALNKVKQACIPHKHWENARAEAFSSLIACSPGEVLCITGPSRAGKSRLILELERLMIGDKAHVPEGEMPIVKLLATNCSVAGRFSTKSFTLRGLEGVEHPFYGVQSDDGWDIHPFKRLERTPEGVLRSALEKSLRNRKTKYLFIDEAQHVQYTLGDGKGSAAVLDSWKCLAEATGVVLVLVGAYPLLDVTRKCTHLLGRMQQVHLPRYQNTPEDIASFIQILDAYSQVVKLPNRIKSLREWHQMLYEGSFGCIGLLDSWLRKAIALADAKRAPCLTKEYLFATRRPYQDMAQIAFEIIEGEKAIQQGAERQDKNAEKLVKKCRKTGKRKGKPFQKNPRRYVVGKKG